MTKLLEWLSGLGLIVALWSSFYMKLVDVSDDFNSYMLLMPIALVLSFGIFSVAVILFRVITFNDCPQACQELKEQIVEARQDLGSKGFNFKTVSSV